MTHTQAVGYARTFAHIHDELPAFHAAYLVMTLLVASMFNLGAFALLIVVHMVLDIVKYREHHQMSWKLTLEGAFRESLIDITLLSVGLVFAIYLHYSVGVSGLSGLLRAEVTVIRAVAMLVPKLKILHDLLKAIAHLHLYLEHKHDRLKRGWNQMDMTCFFFIGISLFLIAIASTVTGVDQGTINWVLGRELLPWRI